MGGRVIRDPKTDLLTIYDEMVVSLVLARCQPQGDGRLRWRIRFDSMRYQADVTLAVRLDPDNREDSIITGCPGSICPGKKSGFATAPVSLSRPFALKTSASFTASQSGSVFAGNGDEQRDDGIQESTNMNNRIEDGSHAHDD